MKTIPLEKVPIEPKGIHLLVDAKVNGIQCKLVLDTGASRTVLDIDFVKEQEEVLHIQKEDSESAGVGGIGLESFSTRIDQMYIGDFELVNLQIALMDLRNVIESYRKIGAPEIKGVLGGDVLETYSAKIDYNKKTLELKAIG